MRLAAVGPTRGLVHTCASALAAFIDCQVCAAYTLECTPSGRAECAMHCAGVHDTISVTLRSVALQATRGLRASEAST